MTHSDKATSSTDGLPQQRHEPAPQEPPRESLWQRVWQRMKPALESPSWWRAADVHRLVFGIAAVAMLLHLSVPQNPHLPAEAQIPNTIVRLTGMLTGLILFLQLAAMARLPLVERCFDRGRIARWHRRLGISLVVALLLHVGLRIYGLIVDEHDEMTSAAAVLDFFTDWAYLGAAIAVLLLLGVVATSIAPLRNRLSGLRWHRIHLLAYLAAAAALPHELLRGTTFTGGLDASGQTGQASLVTDAATVYWSILLTLISAALLWYRLIVPWCNGREYGLRVQQVTALRPGVYSIELIGTKDLREIGFRPGQYAEWFFSRGPLRWPTRATYTVSDLVTKTRLELTVQLRPGQRPPAEGARVSFNGPHGHFTPDARTNDKALIMVAGLGATPMWPLTQQLLRDGIDVTVIQRERHLEHMLWHHQLQQIYTESQTKNRVEEQTEGLPVPRPASNTTNSHPDQHLEQGTLRYLPLPGPAGTRNGRRSWLPYTDELGPGEALRLIDLVPDIGDHDIYLCGPAGWMDAVTTTLTDLGIPPTRIHRERFGW